jgi:hypothetical protein
MRSTFAARLERLEAQYAPLPPAEADAVALLTQAGITPDPWQVVVCRAPAPRSLWLCARQTGKSTLAAALALSTARQEPGSLTLILSPSLRQSQESFRKILDLRHGGTVADTLAASALRLELTNGSRIVSLPGVEDTARGYSGVRLLLIDEAARVPDELYYSIRPMLAVSGGSLVALSTPFGKRGWFFQEWSAGEGWERVKVTAEECPRISPAFLAEERRSLPPLWFASEYLCEFADTVDSVFTYADVMAAVSPSVTPLFGDDPWPI